MLAQVQIMKMKGWLWLERSHWESRCKNTTKRHIRIIAVLTFSYLSSAIEQIIAHECPASNWPAELKETRVSTNNLHAVRIFLCARAIKRKTRAQFLLPFSYKLHYRGKWAITRILNLVPRLNSASQLFVDSSRLLEDIPWRNEWTLSICLYLPYERIMIAVFLILRNLHDDVISRRCNDRHFAVVFVSSEKAF